MSVLLNNTLSSFNALDVSTGSAVGQRPIIIEGYRSGLTDANLQLWNHTTDAVNLSSAVTLQVSSSDSNDTLAGTGARTLYIEGLDSNFNEINEEVSLNGTVDVNTTNQYIKVNNAVVTSVGSNGNNAGIIRVRRTTDPILLINTTESISRHGMYTVPAGKKFLLTGIRFSDIIAETGRNGRMEFRVFLKDHRSSSYIEKVLYNFEIDANKDTQFLYNPSIYKEIPEKNDIILTGSAPVGPVQAGTHVCRATVEGILIDN